MKVRFERISQTEFIASHCSFTQHHPQTLAKSSSCKWEGGYYRCLLADKETVIQELQSLKYSIEDIPVWTNKAIDHLESLAKSNSNELDYLGEQLVDINKSSTYDSLLPYQRQFINISNQRMCNVILADDAGLCKSISALSAVIEYRQQWPLLILTSTSKKEQWVELIKSRISNVSVVVLESQKKQNSKNTEDEQQMIRQMGQFAVVILAYEQAVKYAMILQSVEFKIAVVDDAYQLKNFQVQKSQLLLPIIAKMKYKIVIVSKGYEIIKRIYGDIDQWKPKCIYNYLRAVYPFHFRFVKQFMERYCDPQPSQFVENKIEYEGTSNSLEFEYLLSLAVIRRTYDQVVRSIPDIHRIRYFIKPTPTRSSRVELMLREMKHKNALEQFEVALQQNAIKEQGIYGELLSEIMKIETESKSARVQKYLQLLINKPPIDSQAICSLVVYRSESMKKAIISSNPEAIYILHQTINKFDNNLKKIQNTNTQQIPLMACYLVHISQIESKEVQSIKQRINNVIFTELDVQVDAVSVVDKIFSDGDRGSKKLRCIYLLTKTGVEQILYRIFLNNYQQKNGLTRQEYHREYSSNNQEIDMCNNEDTQNKFEFKKQLGQFFTSKTVTPMKDRQIKKDQVDQLGRLSQQNNISYSIQKRTLLTPTTDKQFCQNYEQYEQQEQQIVEKQMILTNPLMHSTNKKKSCFTQKRLDEFKSDFMVSKSQRKEQGNEKMIIERINRSNIKSRNVQVNEEVDNENDDYVESQSFIEKSNVNEEQGQINVETNGIETESITNTHFRNPQELPIASELSPNSFEEVMGFYGNLFGKINNRSGILQRDKQDNQGYVIKEEQQKQHRISENNHQSDKNHNRTLKDIDERNKKIIKASCFLNLDSVFTMFFK